MILRLRDSRTLIGLSDGIKVVDLDTDCVTYLSYLFMTNVRTYLLKTYQESKQRKKLLISTFYDDEKKNSVKVQRGPLAEFLLCKELLFPVQ